MLGSKQGQLRLRHWQSYAITTLQDLLQTRLDIIHTRDQAHSARSHPLHGLDLLQTRPDLIHCRLDLIHTRLDLIYTQLDLIHTRLDLIHTRLDLIHTRLDLIQS